MVQKPVYTTPKKENVDVDEIIVEVLKSGAAGVPFQTSFPANIMFNLLQQAKDVFASQEVMIEIEPPVKVCGDVHGQFSDVLRQLDRSGFPPCVNYLFLGDYVDRGPQSLEVITLFLAYKVKFPYNFFLLRGNHECGSINKVYGFLDEMQRKYPQKGVGLWNAFQDTFTQMPLTALISEKILCMHGGVSERMESLDQLKKIARQPEYGPESMEMDILWSDPDDCVEGFEKNTRGVGHVFGAEALRVIMDRLKVDLVARAHQVVQDGYEFFANKKLVTIFSAPHYCGSFNNAAAMMNVDKNLTCSFQVMRPNASK